MKLHKPLFSIIVILIQLILSLISYYDFIEWGKANPELNALICRIFHGDSLFIFVTLIGFYEMLTKPSLFKTFLRIFLICIVLGTQFGGLIPIADFYSGVYNTAWFSAVVAFFLILIRIIKK
ncbi:hypothetical protein H2O64_04095 [Kordia sp. YSTF-M3]|uniref:Uncharacterized protein n=1 Tax=Kordia aestuariivivens TaxID=2759037 RepID=A0ABR7Q5L0_9FLAO|nr:hypothetical protein [Kordia aestuariivivens]MBC8753837.1 hypothetical protein [Kordia aestuariivivens]